MTGYAARMMPGRKRGRAQERFPIPVAAPCAESRTERSQMRIGTHPAASRFAPIGTFSQAPGLRQSPEPHDHATRNWALVHWLSSAHWLLRFVTHRLGFRPEGSTTKLTESSRSNDHEARLRGFSTPTALVRNVSSVTASKLRCATMGCEEGPSTGFRLVTESEFLPPDSARPQLKFAVSSALLFSWLSLTGLGFGQVSLLDESQSALYRGNPTVAAEFATEYIRTNPEAAAGFVHLAQAKLAQGDYDGAYRELRKALDQEPENLDALYHLAKLSLILSQVEYGRLFRIAPDSYRVHQLLAETHLARGEYAEAEREYRTALKANPKSVTVLCALGDLERICLVRQGQETAIAAKRAMDYYRQALTIDPTSYNAHYGLAVCYLRQPDYIRDAEEHFRQAINAEPASAVARLGLGEVLVASERWDAAVQQLERATELEPTLREAHFLLGRAYRSLGLRDKATRALEAGLIRVRLA